MSPQINIMQLPHGVGLALPAYETAEAAGMDLRAALPAGEDMVLAPGARALIPTGLAMALPPGFEAQVRPRSGLHCSLYHLALEMLLWELVLQKCKVYLIIFFP